jgi:hypothetical protein
LTVVTVLLLCRGAPRSEKRYPIFRPSATHPNPRTLREFFLFSFLSVGTTIDCCCALLFLFSDKCVVNATRETNFIQKQSANRVCGVANLPSSVMFVLVVLALVATAVASSSSSSSSTSSVKKVGITADNIVKFGRDLYFQDRVYTGYMQDLVAACSAIENEPSDRKRWIGLKDADINQRTEWKPCVTRELFSIQYYHKAHGGTNLDGTYFTGEFFGGDGASSDELNGGSAPWRHGGFKLGQAAFRDGLYYPGDQEWDLGFFTGTSGDEESTDSDALAGGPDDLKAYCCFSNRVEDAFLVTSEGDGQ